MAREGATTMGEDLITGGGIILSAVTAGAGLWVLMGPDTLPDFSVHVYWYLGRSAGFIAYWLLFLSVALGIAVSSRVFDGLLGRPWVFEMHKFLSIFVLLAMLFHVLILLPDPWAKFTPVQMFIPFKSHYRPTAVALGTLCLYGSLIVSASFYLKRFIGGQKGWRWLHYTTFILFLMALAHGLLSGTDTKRQAVQISYLASGVMVLFLVFFRILATRAAGGRPRAERPAVTPRAASRPAATPQAALAGPVAAGSGRPAEAAVARAPDVTEIAAPRETEAAGPISAAAQSGGEAEAAQPAGISLN